MAFLFKFQNSYSVNRLFSKRICNFSSWNDQIKKDMESKNSYLNIDLDNPFTDLDFDSQTTGWRRYWNINDNPEVQYNVHSKNI